MQKISSEQSYQQQQQQEQQQQKTTIRQTYTNRRDEVKWFILFVLSLLICIPSCIIAYRQGLYYQLFYQQKSVQTKQYMVEDLHLTDLYFQNKNTKQFLTKPSMINNNNKVEAQNDSNINLINNNRTRRIIQMSQPRKPIPQLDILLIQLNHEQNNNNKQGGEYNASDIISCNCLLVNSLVHLTTASVNTIVSVLQQSHQRIKLIQNGNDSGINGYHNQYRKVIVLLDSTYANYKTNSNEKIKVKQSKIIQNKMQVQVQINKMIKVLESKKIEFTIHRYKNIQIDPQYQWILNIASPFQIQKDIVVDIYKCTLLTYISHSVQVTDKQVSLMVKQNYSILKNTNKGKILPLQIYQPFGSNADQLIFNQNTNNSQLNRNIYIFDLAYLKIITPFNYAYYAKYTIQDIILRPILALNQLAHHDNTHVNIHSVIQQLNMLDSNIQFRLKQILVQQHNAANPQKNNRLQNKSQYVCYVSYPTDPQILELSSFKSYFQSITLIPQSKLSTIIVYIPYTPYSNDQQYWQLSTYLTKHVHMGYRVRIRLAYGKAVSSLSVYESAYMHCPLSAIMVTSRHNIQFSKSFTKKLLPLVIFRSHLFFLPYIIDYNGLITNGSNNNNINKQEIIRMPQATSYLQGQLRTKLVLYQKYFMHVQIFKQNLFRMLYFWILKKKQIQFYQSQVSFIIPLLQMIRLQYATVPLLQPVSSSFQNQQSFAYRATHRSNSIIQHQQNQNLKKYYQWTFITYNQLRPLQYNCLQNQAFRHLSHKCNNFTQKIPRIIHQVWLGDAQPSQFQKQLHQSIKLANPQFLVRLWRNYDINASSFPYTYALIERSLQYQKYNNYKNRSYLAPIVSLIRYELLYWQGGIYIDFKTQGKKSLLPFLKYQLFFIDLDYQQEHYIYPKNVGNGIIGSIKNSYHMRLVLLQLINQDRFDYRAHEFPKIVGGFVLRQVLTDYEIFTQVGFGFQLFSQKPGTAKPNQCTFDWGSFKKQEIEIEKENKKLFQVEDYKTGRMFQIILPCKSYQQAYLIMYKVLAGTWRSKT